MKQMQSWMPGACRELYYRTGEKMMSAKVRTDEDFAFLERDVLFDTWPYTSNPAFTSYDVAPDGKVLWYLFTASLLKGYGINVSWPSQLTRSFLR